MITYGLTKNQRDDFYTKSSTRVPENLIDFVELSVFDAENIFLQSTRISIEEILSENYVEYSGVIKLNIGQHLRNLGYTDGTFRVQYKFLKKIAGDLQSSFIVFKDRNDNGEIVPYSPSSPYGSQVIDGVLKYFVSDNDGNLDLNKELIFVKQAYNIFDISPSRTELIVEPDDNLASGQQVSLNSQISRLDKDVIFVPLKSSIEGLQGKRIVFDTDIVNPNKETFILRLPENNSNGFDDSLIGNEIIFENFFEAQIPTHYRGQYYPKWKNSYAVSNGTGKDLNIYIRPNEYKIEPQLYNSAADGDSIIIPFFKDDSSFTVSNTNTFQQDFISDDGLFTKRISNSLTTKGISFFPKDVWQTNDLGPRTSGAKNYENAGTFPYKYNKGKDEDNIDLTGELVRDGGAGLEGSALLKTFRGGYKLGVNLETVFLNWSTTITSVIDKRTIVVKSNIKSSYHELRKLGFKITKIGNVDYDRPNQILELPYGRMYSDEFYINDEFNDIEDFRTFLRVNNDYYLITNKKEVSGRTALKLLQPLQPNVIKVGDGNSTQNHSVVDIVEEIVEEYSDTISLIPRQVVNDTFLLPANFDGQQTEVKQRPIGLSSYDSLLSSNDEQNRKLERLLISGSLLDVQPNIDYQKTTTDISIDNDDTGFGNFIQFSNAESRLRNFKSKLELIEGYTAESSSLVNVTSSLLTLQKVERKRQRVIDSFTPYEDFLYFESSSYSSGSSGQFHDTSWPKSNSTSPYVLVHTTGSSAVSWFDNMIQSASNYDFDNQDSLRNTLPEHVNQDPSNNVFLEFMDMVGEQFDETWSYMKSLTDINIRVSSISEGISKDVSKHYADALGIKLFNGNDLVDLSEYLLGKNTDGSNKNESSGEQLTEEIWKRILANLPFFIRTKGTERSLKGILNCYGIPSSVLRVREFGGPDKGTRVSHEIKRKFTRALDFKSSQYIKTDWRPHNDLYPNTTELRFRTPHSVGSSGSMVLVQKSGSGAGSEGSWAISLQDNGTNDNFGHLRFTISASDGTSQFITSSLQPFYNDDFWSVMLTRKLASGNEISSELVSQDTTYELTTKQYDSTRQRIIYESTIATSSAAISKFNAAYTSSGDLYLGGSGTGNHGTQLSGSLMEFRLWSEALSSSVFDNHVQTPKAYNGNFTSSAYENLLLRLPLDDNRNLQTNPTASNIAHLNIFSGSYLGSQINGFTGNFYRAVVDQEKLKVPNLGIRRNATKIRLEDNSLPSDSQLSPDTKQEVSSQDFAPIDTNKLGVYFSPTDVINEDIIYTFADFNFDDQIGDPRDRFRNTYRGLSNTRYQYFKRYNGGSNNFFDYLRILDFYDESVFEVLKQFVPARAQSEFGNLVEPNILERSKQKSIGQVETTSPYYENANDEQVGLQVSRFISGSDNNTIVITGEYPYHEGVIAYATSSLYNGSSFSSLVHLNRVNPRHPNTTTYATASVTFGGTSVEFIETVQPFISSSRLSKFNKVKEFYYTSSLAESTARGFGSTYEYPGGLFVYSSSFEPTDLERSSVDSVSDKLFYLGTQTSKNTDIVGEEPVQITFTSPTTLVTQTPGESRLKTK